MINRRFTISFLCGIFAVALPLSVHAAPPPATSVSESSTDSEAEKPNKAPLDFTWHELTDATKFKVLGLHWFDENQPKLWRMPAKRLEDLPKGVKRRSQESAGARILIRCDSSKLALKLTPVNKGNQKGFDVYLDGRFYKSVSAEDANVETTLVLFRDLERKSREITIYLPYQQELVISNIGVDSDTTFAAPAHVFAKPLPVVFYGSSVCQGTGAAKPGMSYEAIVCRQLNLDFINLGFGGAGKAEPTVVELVNSIPACCYVFDLGKSYGMQGVEPYRDMLRAIRKSHPSVPVICMTPITSSAEVNDPSYAKRSFHDRTVMHDATVEFINSGEKNVYLLEGPDLLGLDEHDGLSKDGVHPSDHGYSLIAQKLLPTLKQAMALTEAQH